MGPPPLPPEAICLVSDWALAGGGGRRIRVGREAEGGAEERRGLKRRRADEVGAEGEAGEEEGHRTTALGAVEGSTSWAKEQALPPPTRTGAEDESLGEGGRRQNNAVSSLRHP